MDLLVPVTELSYLLYVKCVSDSPLYTRLHIDKIHQRINKNNKKSFNSNEVIFTSEIRVKCTVTQ